ncbi:MAG: hypothetical protein Q9195_004852 [Heterodermia aff. obscurata]
MDVETTAIKEQLDEARANDSFEIRRSWRDELYQVRGINGDVRKARAETNTQGLRKENLPVGRRKSECSHTEDDEGAAEKQEGAYIAGIEQPASEDPRDDHQKTLHAADPRDSTRENATG